MSSSPYVRRIRLGSEIRRMRRDAGISSAEALGRRICRSRLDIQRLEAADRNRKIRLDEIEQILGVLDIPRDSDQARELLQIARDAAEVGWWTSPVYRRMGERQARWAEYECGARLCQAYEPTNIHGLVQTEDYAAACVAIADSEGLDVDSEAVVAGRRRRQRQLRDHDTQLEIVVEEIGIRRLIVPPAVMVDQLRHLLHLMESDAVSIQVLPVDAWTVGAQWPREPFTLLAYPDPADPVVAITEAVNEDNVVFDQAAVAHYRQLFARCKEAALSKTDTIAYISKAADQLAATL